MMGPIAQQRAGWKVRLHIIGETSSLWQRDGSAAGPYYRASSAGSGSELSPTTNVFTNYHGRLKKADSLCLLRKNLIKTNLERVIKQSTGGESAAEICSCQSGKLLRIPAASA